MVTVWETDPVSGQRWICLNCDDYAAIHGDATMASYARTIAVGERVRRQGGVRIRFDPPVGRARARKAGYVAEAARSAVARSRTSQIARRSLVRRLPKDAPGRRGRSRSGGRGTRRRGRRPSDPAPARLRVRGVGDRCIRRQRLGGQRRLLHGPRRRAGSRWNWILELGHSGAVWNQWTRPHVPPRCVTHSATE